MRVIAGSAGGIPLSVPDQVARPTTDKVRGAIFSSLGDAVPGARVLDLFAGSGGLGIEALSRGAQLAVFVEHDRRAVDCIRRNLRKCQLEGSVQTMDVFRFLEVYAHPDSFDLVFADPPYRKTEGARDYLSPLLDSQELLHCLAPGGTFVLETLSTESVVLGDDSAWRLLRSKRYGDSAIHFLAKPE